MPEARVGAALRPLAARLRGSLGGRDGSATGFAPSVRRAIADEQDRSERLIGWFQLAIVTTFAVLFALAPKQLPVPIWERVAAWVIIAYLLFTLVRLIVSYKIQLPGWLLALSVVADIALLIVLIWSFHIEYRQPASFSLKAPTLLYVFIFIALRALRFDPRYVLLVGVTAAAGWGLMVLYAVTYDSGGLDGTTITRNYVTYLTSNAVLLGAEFDKIISIVVVTLILSVAIVRARSLLVKSVAEQVAADALARFFSPEIAERIRGSRHEIRAGEGQLRDAAILVVDVRAFTPLTASMRPNEIIALLIEYERRIVPVIQRHGGVVDKFLGDGILATFGCVEPTTTYAADAVRAAQEIATTAESWACEREAARKVPLAIGTAATTGRVVFGAIGDSSRLEFTVIGDAVNLAAKLEKHSKVEGVSAITTAATYALAIEQGFAPSRPPERRPTRKVEGVSAPLDLVVVA
jgi:adenylate cyclase